MLGAGAFLFLPRSALAWSGAEGKVGPLWRDRLQPRCASLPPWRSMGA